MVTIMAVLLTIVTSASAISANSARTEALFLTDKMAYELNLTDDQYNAVYEINLDYIMSVSTEADLSGQYWKRRNRDLSFVLTEAQYNAYIETMYFYRPVRWSSNRMTYVIHNKYPQNRYYRAAPKVYTSYEGGNRSYSHSSYQGRTFSDNKSVAPRTQRTQQPTMKRREAVKMSKSNVGGRSSNNAAQRQSTSRSSKGDGRR